VWIIYSFFFSLSLFCIDRTYIRRYADILKGRISLELLYLPGIVNKQYDLLEEKALCSALLLSDRIDSLQRFSFIPKEFHQTLSKTLFSSGDLLSALIKLSANRMDAFFELILSSSLDVRMKKLIEIQSILDEFLQLIKDDLTDPLLFQMIIQKIITTQLLAFADYLLLLDLSSYHESALIEHIHACETIYYTLSNTYIDLKKRCLCYNESVCASRKESHSSKSGKYSSAAKDSVLYPNYYFISDDLLDSVSVSCNTNIRKAITKSIQDLEIGRQYLLKGLLQETTDGWIGGVLCDALITNITQWLDSFLSQVPDQFSSFIYQEIFQMVILMFVKNVIEIYKLNKSLSLSHTGILQLKSDFNSLLTWIMDRQRQYEEQKLTDQQQQSTKSERASVVLDSDIISACREFLQVIQTFLLCTDTTALNYFADAVLIFGIKYKYHLYDCLRMFLKIRSDINSRVRKAILSICNEFLVQLEQATITNPKLLEGRFQNNCYLLEDLFPLAGVEHCTGMKWKLELPSDPTATRLTVALMVTEICNQAVNQQKRQRNSVLAAASPSPTTVMSQKSNQNGEEENELESLSSKSGHQRVAPLSIRKYTVDDNSLANPTAIRHQRYNSQAPAPKSEINSQNTAVPLSLQQPVTNQIKSKPPQPPPPPPRRKSEVTPPVSQSSKNPFDEDLSPQPSTPLTSSNPFGNETGDKVSEHSKVAQSALPPPKPPRRKSSADESSSVGFRSESTSEKNPFSSELSETRPLTPLTPQEKLNVLLKTAQQSLKESV
jgi:hypothetical protein